jgi:hypothetical protein
MNINERNKGWARDGILVSLRSGPGPLAAAALSHKLPGVRFGPFRGDEFPVILCVCAWLLLSLLAYLMFF